QREGGRAGGKASGNLPQASKGRAADKAAKATGMARRTLEKAEAIVDAAEAEPERDGKLKDDMDRTGRDHDRREPSGHIRVRTRVWPGYGYQLPNQQRRSADQSRGGAAEGSEAAPAGVRDGDHRALSAARELGRRGAEQDCLEAAGGDVLAARRNQASRYRRTTVGHEPARKFQTP